ncbi:MAG TPA: tripartite tricarboxylate transporter TctB family protein [Paracoccaceae bacterium]|jgi:hypothetical protein|nr:tripartite tricarboxylate transporter TctB family protein [Paracoccaceae bacterium]
MKRLSFDPADVAAGIVFVAFGLFFGVQSLGLEMGTPLRMGPGFFPVLLAGLLILLGLGVLLGGIRTGGEPLGAIAVRGILFILPAPIIFGLLVRPAGFVPALFLAALLACFATARMRPSLAVALAAGLTVFATLVFVYGLGLPFRLFGTLFDAPVTG